MLSRNALPIALSVLDPRTTALPALDSPPRPLPPLLLPPRPLPLEDSRAPTLVPRTLETPSLRPFSAGLQRFLFASQNGPAMLEDLNRSLYISCVDRFSFGRPRSRWHILCVAFGNLLDDVPCLVQEVDE